MSKGADLFALLGRCLMAVLFAISGFGKIVAAPASVAYIASAGLPVPPVANAMSIIVELGGSLLLVLGWQTRSVAILLSGFTLVAAVIFHRDFADQDQMIHFLKNIAIVGGFLQVTAFGAGRSSLDGRRNRAAQGAHVDANDFGVRAAKHGPSPQSGEIA